MEEIAREQRAKQLASRETWIAALKKAGLDPDAPGADYEKIKEAFESREWKITAETEFYVQRILQHAKRVHGWLRKRHWRASFTQKGRLIASDNPVLLETAKSKRVGFTNAEFVVYPVSRHALLMGTIGRAPMRVENFNYFAATNTLTLFRADTQIYSHVPEFSWLDENRKHQTNWQLFSKGRFDKLATSQRSPV